MNTQTVQCSNCGHAAAGQFCSNCGASLTGTARWTVQKVVPWAALAVATVAVAVAVTAWFGGGSSAVPRAPELPPFSATLPPAGPSSVDLSSMSPREAADRLFNRVMTAFENGKTAEVRQFAPMALQAYEQAGPLDNDARYHVALLHLTTGDAKGARPQIDALRKAVPKHLLATMLEYQIAEQGRSPGEMARAYEAFLSAYDGEIVAGRSEYDDHRSTLERFYKAAAEHRAGKK